MAYSKIYLNNKMNMDKNFLDNLDSGWGEVLSNTYKEASKYLITLKSRGEKIPLVLDYLDGDILTSDVIYVDTIDISMIHDGGKYINGEQMKFYYNKPLDSGNFVKFYVWSENMFINGMTVEDYFNKMKEEQHPKYKFARLRKATTFDIGLIIDNDNCQYIGPHNIAKEINDYSIYVSEAVKEAARNQM